MQTRRTRFLPKALAVELRRLPRRMLGLGLLALAVAGWSALLSWSAVDPSPGNATKALPHNLLGYRGAGFAAFMMEGFGLASPFLVLPLAAFGAQIARGYVPRTPRLRFACWAAAADVRSGLLRIAQGAVRIAVARRAWGHVRPLCDGGHVEIAGRYSARAALAARRAAVSRARRVVRLARLRPRRGGFSAGVSGSGWEKGGCRARGFWRPGGKRRLREPFDKLGETSVAAR